jgi:hypothetical protein
MGMCKRFDKFVSYFSDTFFATRGLVQRNAEDIESALPLPLEDRHYIRNGAVRVRAQEIAHALAAFAVFCCDVRLR